MNPSIFFSSIEILLETILISYFNNSCVSIISETNLNIISSTKSTSFTYVNPINLKHTNLPNYVFDLFEMFCSNFIVEVDDPTNFIKSFDNALHLTQERRGNRKVIIVQKDYNEVSKAKVLKVLNIKATKYIPDILLILADDDLMKAKDNGNYELVTHKFVGKFNESMPITIDKWNIRNEVFEINANLFLHSDMSNLQGKVINLATFTYKPFIIIEELNGTEVLDGIEIKIISEFCRWINCTIERTPYDGYLWGAVYPNGSAIGIIGSVIKDEADVAIAALYQWYHEYVSLSTPQMRSGVRVLVPVPKPMPGWLFAFRPFKLQTWLLILFTFFVSALVLCALQKRPKSDIIFALFGIFLNQTRRDVSIPDIRRFILWLLLIGLVMDNAYTGGLASTFTIPQYLKSIDTLEDLIDSGFLWGGQQDAWVYSIKNSTQPIILELYRRFRALDADTLHAKAFSGDFGLVMETIGIGDFYSIPDYVTESTVLYLQVLEEDLYWGHIVLLARKSSMYMAKYDQWVLRLQSAGIILAWESQICTKYLNKYIETGLKLARSARKELRIAPLRIDELQSAFYLLGLGILVAMITVWLEILIHKKILKRKRDLD